MKRRGDLFKRIVSLATILGFITAASGSEPSSKNDKADTIQTVLEEQQDTTQIALENALNICLNIEEPKLAQYSLEPEDDQELLQPQLVLQSGIAKSLVEQADIIEENSSIFKQIIPKVMENETIISFYDPERIEELIFAIVDSHPELTEADEIADIIIAEIISQINETKVIDIMQEYKLTEEQFDVVKAICLAEAAPNYGDRYDTTSTLLNRIHSVNWTNYISNVWKKDVGTSLYYQAITSGQFVVYEGGQYKKFLDCDLSEAQAVIDCLYSGIPSHNYLSFKSYEVNGSERLHNGNWYHNPQPESDIIVEEDEVILEVTEEENVTGKQYQIS